MDEPVWEAVRFERVQPTGRTRPLLFECEGPGPGGPQRERFITKALGLPEISDFSLCHEFLGCRLARLFRLAVPQSALINVSVEFLNAAGADLEAAGLRIQSGIAVGSQFIPNLLPFPADPRINEAEAADAALVYVFDLLTQNPDRRRTNPNCGRAGGRIVPFDFESAFSFRFGIMNPEPWNVAGLPFAREHLFYACIRQFDAEIDWPLVFGRLWQTSLDDVTEACSTIPRWADIVAEVLAHLTAVFAHQRDFERQVHASLGRE